MSARFLDWNLGHRGRGCGHPTIGRCLAKGPLRKIVDLGFAGRRDCFELDGSLMLWRRLAVAIFALALAILVAGMNKAHPILLNLNTCSTTPFQRRSQANSLTVPRTGCALTLPLGPVYG